MTRERRYWQRYRRLNHVIVMGGRENFAYTGDNEALTVGLTYRTDDVTIVWSGGPKCVIVPCRNATGPRSDRPFSRRLIDSDRDLTKLVEAFCDRGHKLMPQIADGWRNPFGASHDLDLSKPSSPY